MNGLNAVLSTFYFQLNSSSNAKSTDDQENVKTKKLRHHPDSGNTSPKTADAGKLVEEEKVETGSVPMQTYLIYIKYTGGICCAILVLIIFILAGSSTGYFIDVDYSYLCRPIL